MPGVISIHRYELRPGASPAQLRAAFRSAGQRRLFALSGLRSVRLVRGIKGEHHECLATLWEYESQDAWEALWGPPEVPKVAAQYPEPWMAWEESLAPLLDRPPDSVTYTAFEVLEAYAPDAERNA